MEADVSLKNIRINSGWRMLEEVIESWDLFSFEEKLHIVKQARDVRKQKWQEGKQNPSEEMVY